MSNTDTCNKLVREASASELDALEAAIAARRREIKNITQYLTHPVRSLNSLVAALREMSELYEERRSDVVDNINSILDCACTGETPSLVSEKRYITAEIPLLGGILTVEYDTLTTIIMYKRPGADDWREAVNHKYLDDECATERSR